MIGVEGVSVRFGATLALDNVTLQIVPGTIHALAGENGSGKSTLLKILGGVLSPTEGTATLDGHPIVLKSVRDGLRHGIGVVFQELSLFPHLSGFSNIAIGNEPVNRGFVKQHELRQQVANLLERVRFPDIDLDKPVSELPIAEKQMIEILKCLYKSPRVILFDEPTASLTRRESVSLLKAIKQLRDAGYTIVFVSHHLDEVFELADSVTVLRDGQLVLSSPIGEINQGEVLTAMLGRKFEDFFPSRKNRPSNKVLLSLKKVQAGRFEPVDLDVYEGEVLGIAGAVGSGANILADVMAGWRPIRSGAILMRGKTLRIRNPATALKFGIGYVPEDRRGQALLLGQSVSINGTLPLIASPHSPLLSRGLFLRKREEKRLSEYMISHLGVRPQSTKIAIGNLSGGNQQKVVIGRWLLRDVSCLVLNNPTKGIDVGAKHDVYRHILSLADGHHGIVFVSSYNDELLGVSDRIAVMYKGQLLGPFLRSELDDEKLLRLTMTGTMDVGSGQPLTGGRTI